MTRNIYDDTVCGYDSTLYDDSCNTDYSTGSLPIGYPNLPYRVDRMEELLWNMCRQRKKKLHYKKRYHKQNKELRRLKKHLRKIEKQNEYVFRYLVSTMAPMQNAGSPAWLQKSVDIGIPRILDFALGTLASKIQHPKGMNQPLCLPDKNGTR